MGQRAIAPVEVARNASGRGCKTGHQTGLEAETPAPLGDAGVLGRASKTGREGFDKLAKERALDVVTFRDWKKIEEAEERAAREGAPREKFVDIEAMINASH